MITLFVIGIMIFVVKLILLAIKAAWGITKAIFFVLGLPVLLILMLIAGLVYVALPLLLLALVAAFVWPMVKGI